MDAAAGERKVSIGIRGRSSRIREKVGVGSRKIAGGF